MDRVYKGITLENLNKDVSFISSSTLSAITDGKYNDENVDYTEKLLRFDKKLLTDKQFEKISALNSVINMNYQIKNGGIDLYFFNEYDRPREPQNEQDVARLGKDGQEEMMDELLFFGLDVFPEYENQNKVLDEVISQFKKIFVEDEEHFETIYPEEDEKIWDEEKEELVKNPDYFEPYEESMGFETVLRNEDGFDDKYYSVNEYLETLIEGYAQYLCKSFEREKDIVKKPGIDELMSEGSKKVIEKNVLDGLFKDVEHEL